jgi:peptidoglycan/LPS O-acetylase OafA/YrhL
MEIKAAPLQQASPRWQSIDVLRGIAALLVLTFHFTGLTGGHLPSDLSWNQLKPFLLQIGSSGTNLLLLLSGFFVASSMRKPDFTYTAFLRSRMIRLYFPYLFFLLLTQCFWNLFPGFSKPHPDLDDLTYLFQQFLLFPGLFPERPMLTVTWTLSFIFAGYCLLPLAPLLWRRIFPSLTSALPAWTLCIALLLAANLTWGSPIYRTVYIPTGCVLAELLLDNRLQHRSKYWLLALLLCGLLHPALHLLALAALVAVTLSLGRHPQWPTQNPLLHSLSWIGRRGYSVYLLHGPIAKVLVGLTVVLAPTVFKSSMSLVLLYSLALALTLIASQISYYLLELRGPRWFEAKRSVFDTQTALPHAWPATP